MTTITAQITADGTLTYQHPDTGRVVTPTTGLIDAERQLRAILFTAAARAGKPISAQISDPTHSWALTVHPDGSTVPIPATPQRPGE